LEKWDHATGDISLVRNDSYWRGPAKLARIVIKKVNEFSTRKLMLQNGDADIATINRAFVDQVDGTPGVRLIKGQVRMSLGFILFNQKTKVEGNPYLGSGQLDGKGIPPDFFSDIDVRKGFNYAFDWETFIREAIKNEAEQARGPIPRGVPYFNPENPVYRLDLQKAEEHLKRAWGGQVWERGFKFTAPYLVDDQASKILFEILRRNLQRLNPKFDFETVNLEWSTLLKQSVEGTIPLYSAAWLEDYHDAHNWVFPLMHSQGNYSASMNLGGKYDALVDQGINELDSQKRQAIYYELQRLAYEDAIAIWTDQPLGRHYQQRWVDGYYFNPIWPGRNFYPLSKKPDAKPNMQYINQLGLVVEEW
jgi:peptide/nickel transport system substrate-binding protein